MIILEVGVTGLSRARRSLTKDLDRSTDIKTSAVHFMRFEMTDEMADALKNDADWMIGVQHPVYTYELRVEGATRDSLLNDLH